MIKILQKKTLAILFIVLSFCCHAQVQLGPSICGEISNGKLGEGVAVSSDGFTIAIASIGFAGDRGMVQVYRFDGQSFTQLGQTLIGGFFEGLFGAVLDISDDGRYLAVSEPFYFTDRGKVTVYEYIDNLDNWNQIGQDIVGFDPRIGTEVIISNDGNKLLVGGETNSFFSTISYDQYQLNNDTWERTGPRLKDGFRNFVKISGDESTYVFGARGSGGKNGAVVYTWDGEDWTKKGQRVTNQFKSGSASGDVCINYDGSIMAFADLFSSINGGYTGTTWVYQFVNGLWQPLGDPIYGLDNSDRSGTNLDMNDKGDRISIHSSGSGTHGGKIRIYDLKNGEWVLENESLGGGGRFGYGMDLNDNGNIIGVGASEVSCNGLNSAGRFKLYEIAETTGSDAIIGTIFFDANMNKIRDDDENGIPNIKMKTTGSSSIYLTDFEGKFVIHGEQEVSYTLSPDLENEWEITTDSSNYSIKFDPHHIESYDFGIYRAGSEPSARVFVSSEPTRCNSEVDFYLRILNDGYITIDGELDFTLDNLVEFVSASHLIEENELLRYQINDLRPFESLDIILTLAIPSEEAIGELLKFKAEVISDQDVLDSRNYESIVLCAFDPNDKEVSPLGVKDENYTLIEDELHYTIRFQNTGNDVAIDVKVLDTLDSFLDMETFEVTNSSHSLKTSFDGSVVEFRFDNIYLIDSFANEPGSHGFVQYKIKSYPNIEELVEIDNTAHIIFDHNPAIITNTTHNTMVENICQNQYIDGQITICEGENYFGYTESGIIDLIIPIDITCDSFVSVNLIVLPESDANCVPSNTYDGGINNIDVFPNPVNSILYIQGNTKKMSFELIDVHGRVVLTTNEVEINISNLNAGIYFLRSTNSHSSFIKQIMKL